MCSFPDTVVPAACDEALVVADSEVEFVEMLEVALAGADVNNALLQAGDAGDLLATLRQQYAAGTPPRLVLLDWDLPGGDVEHLLATIRRDAALAMTPIVVWSRRCGGDEARRAYEHGASAFLPKPRSRAELVEVLAAVKVFWLSGAVPWEASRFPTYRPPSPVSAPPMSGVMRRRHAPTAATCPPPDRVAC